MSLSTIQLKELNLFKNGLYYILQNYTYRNELYINKFTCCVLSGISDTLTEFNTIH